MKKLRRAVRDGRRMQRTTRAGAIAARKGADLAQAAGHVVAKRASLALLAMADPAQADHAEFARILPEKAAAFSAAATALMRGSETLVRQAAEFASSEMVAATKTGGELALCRTPTAVAAVQGRHATAWFFRALSQSIAVGALAMQTYGAVMAPVQRVAVGNARRLV